MMMKQISAQEPVFVMMVSTSVCHALPLLEQELNLVKQEMTHLMYATLLQTAHTLDNAPLNNALL
jgi:hypothetical protein